MASRGFALLLASCLVSDGGAIVSFELRRLTDDVVVPSDPRRRTVLPPLALTFSDGAVPSYYVFIGDVVVFHGAIPSYHVFIGDVVVFHGAIPRSYYVFISGDVVVVVEVFF